MIFLFLSPLSAPLPQKIFFLLPVRLFWHPLAKKFSLFPSPFPAASRKNIFPLTPVRPFRQLCRKKFFPVPIFPFFVHKNPKKFFLLSPFAFSGIM